MMSRCSTRAPADLDAADLFPQFGEVARQERRYHERRGRLQVSRIRELDIQEAPRTQGKTNAWRSDRKRFCDTLFRGALPRLLNELSFDRRCECDPPP